MTTAHVGPALEAVVDADGLPAAWIDLAWLARSAARTPAGPGSARGRRSGSASSRPRSRWPPAPDLERLGDTASADHWYATALTQLPRLAADPYWQDPARQDRWAGIEAEAADRLPPGSRVDLYLSAGEPELASEGSRG